MKFPYAMCDFYDIITNNYFYIDRTDRISLLESRGKNLLFLRPRRFGKSLVISMLQNYYDFAKANDFERLFGHLAIGKQPTALHNQYFVLKWDFSVVSPQGDTEKIERNLHLYLNSRMTNFAVRYQESLPRKIEVHPTNAMVSFQSLLDAVQETPHKLYLLIDEYDNFANEVMMSDPQRRTDRYETLVYGDGCLKAVFKGIKSAFAGEGLDRTFITGVSPVLMHDITSGHNIAEDIYFDPEFHDLCGFDETEVAEILQQVIKHCELPEENAVEVLNVMRKFYNGYAFCYECARDKGLLYNPTLVLYFLKHFQARCTAPRRILDSNLAPDYVKIEYVSSLPGGEEVVARAVDAQHPLSIPELAQRFGVREMVEVTEDAAFCASLLYYLGVLTLGELDPQGRIVLNIPNLVTRRLYVERIQKLVAPKLNKTRATEAAEALYINGDMQSLCSFIERQYFKVFDNRDYRWANELTVKTAFLSLLFEDTFYIMESETALDRKYADLTMIIRPDMRRFQLLDILIEFKYVSLDDAGVSGEAVKQLSTDDLKALFPVKKKLKEAKTSLNAYRRTLETRHGDVLRLRVYTVVAVGFERLVWEEMT